MTASWEAAAWPASESGLTARQSDLFDGLVAIFLHEGFAHFTLADLAARLRCSKSTLYALAHSKEQLAVAVVVHFFRTAAERISDDLALAGAPADRVGRYLNAVAAELRPASPSFRRDLANFPPTRAVYELNTRIAAARIRELVAEGVAAGAFRDVDAQLVGQVATLAMVAIEQGDMGEATGLTDADAYAELAKLLVRGLARRDSVDGEPAAGEPAAGEPADGEIG